VPASSVGQVRGTLEAHGAAVYLQAGFAEIDLSFHDTSALFGHDLELHADVEALRSFFGMFREAAEHWDGSDPIRPAVA
jgi:hypothetical protein